MRVKTDGGAGRRGRCSVPVRLAAVVTLGMGGWTIAGCDRTQQPTSSPTESQPAAAVEAKPGLPEPNQEASNSACLDCHMDFADELISAKHLKAGFACTTCHGASIAHGEDEANATKPDVLFGRTQITPFCKQCHPTHKSGEVYEAFVKEWRGRRRPTGVMLLEDATCTDCHGHHVRGGGA